MMEPRQLRYSEIRSEEGEADPGASQNNIDVAVHVDLMDTFRVSDSLLPEKLNALLTSQACVNICVCDLVNDKCVLSISPWALLF